MRARRCRLQIKAQEEAIRLKGPEEAKRLLAPGESSTSDQYTKYWEKMEAKRAAEGRVGMKEETANNQTFFGRKEHAPKMVAQTEVHATGGRAQR